MEAAKVAEFVARSGADPEVAHRLLRSECWDEESSLKLYKILQDSHKVHQLQSSMNSSRVSVPPQTTVVSTQPLYDSSQMPFAGIEGLPGELVRGRLGYHRQPQQQQRIKDQDISSVPREIPRQDNLRMKTSPFVSTSNKPSGYRPPVGPKPHAVSDNLHYYDHHQLQPQQLVNYAPGLEQSMLISHSKSDSVDSSDGLRRASSVARNHSARYGGVFEGNRSGADMGQTSLQYQGGSHNGGGYVVINDRDTAAPTPPPRSYKLVHATDNKGYATPVLVYNNTNSGSQFQTPGSHQQQRLSPHVFTVPSNSVSRNGSSSQRSHHHSGRHSSRSTMMSAPASRYGSSSSINHAPDCSPLVIPDYRVHLSSVRATLEDDQEPDDINYSRYGSQVLHASATPAGSGQQDLVLRGGIGNRSYRNSFVSEGEGSAVEGDRSSSNSGSRPGYDRSDYLLNMDSSSRCNSPMNSTNSTATSRASVGSAKNALLREKVMGLKKFNVSSVDPTASPVLSRDSRSSSKESYEIGRRLAKQSSTISSPSVNIGRNAALLEKRSEDSIDGSRLVAMVIAEEPAYAKPNVSSKIIYQSMSSDSRISPSKVSSMVDTFNAAAEQQALQWRESRDSSRRGTADGDRGSDNYRRDLHVRDSPEQRTSVSTNRGVSEHTHSTTPQSNARPLRAPPSSAVSSRLNSGVFLTHSSSDVSTNSRDEGATNTDQKYARENQRLSFTNAIRKSNMEPGLPNRDDRGPSSSQTRVSSRPVQQDSGEYDIRRNRQPLAPPSSPNTIGNNFNNNQSLPSPSTNNNEGLKKSKILTEESSHDDSATSKETIPTVDSADSGLGASRSNSGGCGENNNSGSDINSDVVVVGVAAVDADVSDASEKAGAAPAPAMATLNDMQRTVMEVGARRDHKLNRNLSRAPDNADIVCKARNELTQGIWDALEGYAPHSVHTAEGDVGTEGLREEGGVGDSEGRGGGEVKRSPAGFVDTPLHTFLLPDLSVYEAGFRTFVEKDLIEMPSLRSLESCGRLNWWSVIGAGQRLWPLATTGDGNCLLHAASLGMWGFHDRRLCLRAALHDFVITSPCVDSLWRRWRWHTSCANAATGLVYSDQEWETEWRNVLRLASTQPRTHNNNNNNTNNSNGNNSDSASGNNSNGKGKAHRTLSEGRLPSPCDSAESVGAAHDSGGGSRNGGRHLSGSGAKRLSDGASSPPSAGVEVVYESLEEIHILALAHVLRRPIIVVADVVLKDVHGAPLSPISFGGVYLPVALLPGNCHRSPLLLTYEAAHFSALVVMEGQSGVGGAEVPAIIPLTSSQHCLLPVHFAMDPGENFLWGDHVPLGENQNGEHWTQRLEMSWDDKVALLKEYLDVVEVPIPSQYQDYNAAADFDSELPGERCYTPITGFSQPDEDRRSESSGGDSDDPLCTCGEEAGRSRALHSKQCNSSRKQNPRQLNPLGSIGRSMSKRIKKKFGMKRMARASSLKRKDADGSGDSGASGSKALVRQRHSSMRSKSRRTSAHQSFILAATLHTEKRMVFQEEMIQNYLSNARRRYQDLQEEKKKKGDEAAALSGNNSSGSSRKDVVDSSASSACGGGYKDKFSLLEGNSSTSVGSSGDLDSEMTSNCINPGCALFGTALTSYMCTSCYVKQKDEEMQLNRRRNTQQRPSQQQLKGAPDATTDVDAADLTITSRKGVPLGSTSGEDSSTAIGVTTPTFDRKHGTSRKPLLFEGPHYGAGKSQFYAELDREAAIKASANIPTVPPPNSKKDSTMFLSNSTFYNDAAAGAAGGSVGTGRRAGYSGTNGNNDNSKGSGGGGGSVGGGSGGVGGGSGGGGYNIVGASYNLANNNRRENHQNSTSGNCVGRSNSSRDCNCGGAGSGGGGDGDGDCEGNNRRGSNSSESNTVNCSCGGDGDGGAVSNSSINKVGISNATTSSSIHHHLHHHHGSTDEPSFITPISVNNVHLPPTGVHTSRGLPPLPSSSNVCWNPKLGPDDKTSTTTTNNKITRVSSSVNQNNNNNKGCNTGHVVKGTSLSKRAGIHNDSGRKNGDAVIHVAGDDGGDDGGVEHGESQIQRQCLKKGCQFYGSAVYGGFCSKCHGGIKSKKK